MDQAAIIEEIICTKNTLTILHRVFIANQNSLQQFSPIFDLITELIDILTHSSPKQIEMALLSNGTKLTFSKLKDILNELSDAITTKNISMIDSLNEQLTLFVEKLRMCSSYETINEETADEIFKKQLLQSPIDKKTKVESEPPDAPEMPIFHFDDEDLSPSHSESIQKEEKSPRRDPFAHFRFARRPLGPSSAKQDDYENTVESPSSSGSSPPPPPPSQPIVSHPVSHAALGPSKPLTTKPRLMISYNHASQPVCIDIYNSLTNDGYDVWIDLKQMHGSTLVAMAQGIEESDIILYCITENYSQSPYCQKEAEYAFVRQKIMIPLLLQPKYKPIGWLGLLLGASLYIDFTKNDFTQNYEKLKKEIEAQAIRISSNKNDGPQLTLTSTINDNAQTDKKVDNPPLQLPKTNSVSNTNKSRSCILL